MNKSSFKKKIAVLAVLSILIGSGGFTTTVQAQMPETETVQEESSISMQESDTEELPAAQETIQEEETSPVIETEVQEESGQTENAAPGSAVSAESESGESEVSAQSQVIAEKDGRYTLTAKGDGYKISLSFTKEDLPENVDPEKLALAVSKVTGYSRTDEGIEPVKKTTITYPSFAVTLKDAAGKTVKAKSGKTFTVTASIPASVLPAMVDTSSLKLLSISGTAAEPALLASMGKSSGNAGLAIAGRTITASFKTAALAAGYGLTFDFLEPVPIRSSSAASGSSVRKAAAKAADDAEDIQPEVHKTVTPNGDGTYKITLSITGKAQSSTDSTKADVIVVYDKSSSMKETTTYYQASQTGSYGLVNGQYVQLYRPWGRGYRAIGNETYNGTVYYRQGRNYREYSGSRYTRGSVTRASAAKDAVDTLAQSLLTNNTNGDVQLSIVTFGTDTNGVLLDDATKYDGTTINAIETLDDIPDNEGTNWEAALNDALTQVQGGREEASKYVIFVSDGDPTFRTSSYPHTYEHWYWGTVTVYDPDDADDLPDGVHGAGNSDDYGFNYDAAKKKAEDIVKAVGSDNFFAIGAFGNVSNMEKLVQESGANPSNYYNASDGAALAAAFDNIIKAITHALEIRNARLTDTVTSLTSVGASVNPDSEIGKFTYTKSNDPDWTSKSAPTITDGKIQWSPAAEGESLEAGVTYSVSFNVWPSQEAYDLVADLKNGKITYDQLTAEQREQIKDNGDGSYALRTNSTAEDDNGNSVNQVTYTQVELSSETEAAKALTDEEKAQIKEGGGADVTIDGHTFRYNESAGTYEEVIETEHTVEYPDPNNGEMPLNVAKVTIEKKWQDEKGNDLSDQVADGNAVFTVSSKDTDPITLTLNKENGWTGTAYLAPGIKVKEETLEQGHDYTIAERSSDTGSSGLTFTYEGDTIEKPMLVDGKFVNNSGEQTFTGVNKLRTGSLILRKILAGRYVDPAKEFSLAVTAGEEWKSRLTGTYPYTVSQFDLADAKAQDPTVNDAQDLPAQTSGSLKFDPQTGQAVDSTTSQPLLIKNGWQIDVQGLPQGTALSVQEDAEDAPAADYKVTYNGKEEDSCSLTISDKEEDNTVVITNSSKVKVPDTAVAAAGNGGLMILLAGAALAALAGVYGLRRHHR